MPKIVALIDGSPYAESVLGHAAWAAGAIGAAVDVVHVIGRREGASVPADLSGSLELGAHANLLRELAEHDIRRARLVQQRGRLIVDGGVAWLHEAGVAAVQGRLRNGDIVEAVQDLEATADLLLVGKRGEAADFARLHLGSNLERIARVSHKPVFIAARAFRPIKRFLIAFDGGASIMKAIDHIAKSDLLAGLPCRLLTAGRETPEIRDRMEASADLLRTAGYEASTSIVSGEAAAVIAEQVEADHIDLLVIGAYGHSRIRNFIIGSTTAEMIRSVRIPVLLFR